MYDVVIVGAGFAGSIMAYKYATVLNKRVLVVEKRNHIAGNMFDFRDEFGIQIQKYGPHTFHTNSEKVYDFISEFCEISPYHLKCEAIVNGEATPSPFNFKTIEQFYPKEKADLLKKKLLNKYGPTQATVLELLNSSDVDIKEYAEFLFKNDYSIYTAKQWGKKPSEIDPSVLKRVPIIFNYRDTYFSDKYEGVPKTGFTTLFEKMLSRPNITIQLNVDAKQHISFAEDEILYDGNTVPLIFTGAIDELFDYKFGKLPYRSLWFDYQYHDIESFQNVAIVAHPADMECTRITEYTKLPYQKVGEKTVIAIEYSLEYDKNATRGNEPYYPVLTEKSQEQYQLYRDYSKYFNNLVLCGRLADFKYYNMDAVIQRTLDVFETIEYD